ncbi:DUF2969 family protein [Fructilactobacillus fructivorans]|uniref:DUF2969 family protein n=1 Tax=Fructilactobacillus fructivorans TaxID=1614 RepID=A0A0C1Q166_9LACO|nr:DUF2969 family protein [Fructilactobacillus fructivorans]KID41588.1 hypothetical protein LfDm3_0830 [Fructilactobacillus fructivorans]KRK57826.1 hypothetical protein FC73_GL000836 [Fructilactobacillus fructivorans]KRN12633.1 hypothetical protein IV37_GL000931 [Fructilactobacillus fructivorans]KRN40704.1 hypothetical protein IV51_GL001327 [Fructilactobacillus fructivorans]KRN43243.1 hypothetical protein IV48_GL000800 [Fructilactobacillus fructivorans]
MSRKEKQIGVNIVEDPEEKALKLVQIGGHTVGTIEEKNGKSVCVIGDKTFHENSEEDAVAEVIREYNLHQR